MRRIPLKSPRLRLAPELYGELRLQVLRRDGWRCQSSAPCRTSRFTIGNCVATLAMIQSKTLLPFVPDATRSYIGDLIEECSSFVLLVIDHDLNNENMTWFSTLGYSPDSEKTGVRAR